MSADEHEHVWIQRASAGDRVSLTLLLTEVRPLLVAHVAGRIPSNLRGVVDAEDVVQEALAVAARTLSHFHWDGPGSFYRWVATIAVRKLRDWLRRYRALKRGGPRAPAGGSPGPPSDSYVQLLDELVSAERTASRSMARLEAAAALHAALRELPDDYRRAIELVYLEGHSVQAVAAEMGRTEHAIHHLCNKARGRLRELLGEATHFLSGAGRETAG